MCIRDRLAADQIQNLRHGQRVRADEGDFLEAKLVVLAHDQRGIGVMGEGEYDVRAPVANLQQLAGDIGILGGHAFGVVFQTNGLRIGMTSAAKDTK